MAVAEVGGGDFLVDVIGVTFEGVAIEGGDAVGGKGGDEVGAYPLDDSLLFFGFGRGIAA